MEGSKNYKLMIVAGESSGDSHAAHLVGKLKTLLGNNSISFFGTTGPKMREAGVETVLSADDFSVVGVPEVIKALPKFLRVFKSLSKEAAKRRPDAVILVDFPEFNLKFARKIKSLGIPVVYFISPQVWAWRRYRINGIRRNVDLLLSIFPFEKSWYSSMGFGSVVYVGNPTADRLRDFKPRSIDSLKPDSPRIALLPGSRSHEIDRIFPTMVKAAVSLSERYADPVFLVPAASEAAAEKIDAILRGIRLGGNQKLPQFDVRVGEFSELVGSADVAAVASGTATLETALHGVPMTVVYKSSVLNYLLLRPLISVPHFALVNLIAGKRLATELIQFDFSKEKLATEIVRLLDPEINKSFKEELEIVKKRLIDASEVMDPATTVASFLSSISKKRDRGFIPRS